MYGRRFGEDELRFEPSGGLLHASLVMQDKETDSYWSIMTGDALAGDFRGTELRELPVGEKLPFGEWRQLHPHTLVLSVDGLEHDDSNPYDNYFDSEEGFRGAEAEDPRLPTKAPIFAFQLDGDAYAVPFTAFAGGAEITLDDGRTLVLYRPEEASIFLSTEATLRPADGAEDQSLEGFDTFWFNWSMIHPETRILGTTDAASEPAPHS